MGIKGLKWIQEKKKKMAMKRLCKGMVRACKKYTLYELEALRDNSEIIWLARAKEF